MKNEPKRHTDCACGALNLNKREIMEHYRMDPRMHMIYSREFDAGNISVRVVQERWGSAAMVTRSSRERAALAAR